MKVLLCEDVSELGWLGDVVEVADGYGRNYLLPQGLAIVPNESNLKSLEQEKVKRAEQRLKEQKLVEVAAQAVEGAEVVLQAKANEQGHLFGSITEVDIAENLRAQGFEITERIVQLPEHIKEVGSKEVSLKFSPEQIVKVKVTIVAEQDAENAETDGEK